MFELYKARLVHIEALSQTSLFSDIELSIVQKTADAIRKTLKIQDQDITNSDVINRVIQSSRNLYIGNHETPISDAAKSSLSGFLMNLISGNELGSFTVTEINTDARCTSVSIKQMDLEFSFDFYLLDDPKDTFNKNKYEVSVSKVDVEPFMDGWVTRSRTLMIKCDIGHYWTNGEVIRYLHCINEQGLRVDNEAWLGHRFEEHESLQIIFEFVLSNEGAIDEEDLINLRLYTDECIFLALSGMPSTFDEGVRCLTNLTNYLASTYSYSQYGYDFGEQIAIGFLMHTLMVSENDKHIENISHALVDGLIDVLDIDDIKPKIIEHIQQINADQEFFECVEGLEVKVDKLYEIIDKHVTEYQDDW